MARVLNFKHAVLGFAAFALTVLGIYASGDALLASGASTESLASSSQCVSDRNALSNEVYFVSCGGFF